MQYTTPRPPVARYAAQWAERNLRQLGLLVARDMDRATTEDERIEIAAVGIAIARARQQVLPVVMRHREDV